MKIIEALKELPLIEKKIIKNNELLQKYSSYASHIGSEFKTEKEQTAKVNSIIQSNEDLVNRYLQLKRILSLTNATVEVEINNIKLTLIEWLAYKNTCYKLLIDTFNNLNIGNAESQLMKNKPNIKEGDTLGVIRCYVEKDRLTSKEKIQDTMDKIDATLEIVNATTDLIEDID